MNIWWNQWFSTAYHLIVLMKNGKDDIHTIGSNSNNDCVYRTVCDEWYSEPPHVHGDEYADYCIEFCKSHNVDIFVPRHNLGAVVKHRKQFAAEGVKLLANTDPTDFSIADDKICTYRHFGQNGLTEYLPPYFECNNVVEFRSAVSEMRKNYRTCFKLSLDEGALTYHVIEEDWKQSIRKKTSSHVTPEEADSIVSDYSFSIPILVMPYLDDPEISVDCLRTEDGLIALPRFKLTERVSKVDIVKKVIEAAEKIDKLFSFEMPYNIQLRYMDGELKLLEINPRMSGGLQYSCAATGINLPALALNKLTGKPVNWSYPDQTAKKVAYLETPIIL